MNGPEEKPNNLGVERRFPGHLDIEPMWFMNAAGNWSGQKIGSNSGDKLDKLFKLLCGVKGKKRYLSRHSLNCYTITIKRYL
jgi:hypothetical protein